MKFLFDAIGAGKPREIYVVDTGVVHATHIADTFNASTDTEGRPLPATSKFVGKLSEASGNNQLTSVGNLTDLGRAYCKVMGVEANAEALGRFAKTNKVTKVDLKLLQQELV
jgi:hypothetical protein